VKAQVHVALCGLLLLCGCYNGIAFARRREAHLAVNGVVYLGGAAWEVQQIARHLEPRPLARRTCCRGRSA
jgi:hypothetical protein